MLIRFSRGIIHDPENERKRQFTIPAVFSEGVEVDERREM